MTDPHSCTRCGDNFGVELVELCLGCRSSIITRGNAPPVPGITYFDTSRNEWRVINSNTACCECSNRENFPTCCEGYMYPCNRLATPDEISAHITILKERGGA
jgi:hypothetical protein